MSLTLIRRIILCIHVDLPPAKRRRGLAGSIVSTAWSAALIGTAVGLTVYKLWRNRGKGSQEDPTTEPYGTDNAKFNELVIDTPPEPSSPPPPYNQEWTAIDYPQQFTPRSREKGKQRMTPRTQRRTAIPRPQQVRRDRPVARRGGTLGRSAAAAGPSRPAIQPEFDFESSEPRKRGRTSYGSAAMEQEDADMSTEVDEQMDWIGGKLAQLIEEGKKALGKEVVVMSEAKEDEEDDGSGAWVDEEERGRLSRRGSTRSRRSTVTGGNYISSSVPSSSFVQPPSSSSSIHQPSRIPVPVVPTTPRRQHTRGMSHDGMGSPGLAISDATRDDASHWESPEMREMMERARAKYSARLAK